MRIFFVHSIFSIAPLHPIEMIGANTSPVFIHDMDTLESARIATFPAKRIAAHVIIVHIIHFRIRFGLFFSDESPSHSFFLSLIFVFFFAVASLWVLKFDMP